MKKLNLFITLTILVLPIGTILMLGGNHIGEYLVSIGSIMGLYTCYLLDQEDQKKPENPL